MQRLALLLFKCTMAVVSGMVALVSELLVEKKALMQLLIDIQCLGPKV